MLSAGLACGGHTQRAHVMGMLGGHTQQAHMMDMHSGHTQQAQVIDMLGGHTQRSSQQEGCGQQKTPNPQKQDLPTPLKSNKLTPGHK